MDELRTLPDPVPAPEHSPQPRQVRQGDVLLVEVEAAPGDATSVARDAGRIVLASGEVTGHAHAIHAAAARLVARGDDRYLVADGPVTLEHEEHGPIAVEPGTYRVAIQREYVPAELAADRSRRVAD